MKLLNEGESVIYDTCGDSVVEIGELALQVKDLINKKVSLDDYKNLKLEHKNFP